MHNKGTCNNLISVVEVCARLARCLDVENEEGVVRLPGRGAVDRYGGGVDHGC